MCGKNESVIIKITDTRINKTPWNLYASINEELTSTNGKSLNKGLIFYDENKNIFPLFSNQVLVYKKETNTDDIEISNITWSEDEGILLQINNPIFINTNSN